MQAATINCARLFCMDHELGQVAAGHLADLLLVDGNPLEDIGVLTQPQQHLKLIIKGGQVVRNALTPGDGA